MPTVRLAGGRVPVPKTSTTNKDSEAIVFIASLLHCFLLDLSRTKPARTTKPEASMIKLDGSGTSVPRTPLENVGKTPSLLAFGEVGSEE